MHGAECQSHVRQSSITRLKDLLMSELSSSAAVWVQAVATIVLVLVTVYYAWQNRQMATANRDANSIARDTLDEIRKSRIESLRPHLALSLEFFAPTYVKLRVTNLGGGAARELITLLLSLIHI